MTDELRAKFEAWCKLNALNLPLREHPARPYWYAETLQAWNLFNAGHASRDAEVEALKRDAEIGRYVLKYAAWIRDGDDTLMEIRFSGHIDLSSIGTRRDAIDDAMAKE